MKFLSKNECSEWLKGRRITEEPYGQSLKPMDHYLQFAPPEKTATSDFVSALLGALDIRSEALLQMHEWAWDPEYEGDPTAELRTSRGESRWLIDLPGFVLAEAELPETARLSVLALTRGWRAYLYTDSSTLLLWDGALIDFWGKERSATERVRTVLARFDVRVAHDHGR